MRDRKFAGCFKGFLPDHRIEKRAEKVLEDMFLMGTVVVNKFCSTFKEKKAAYELFKNLSFTEMDLIKSQKAHCRKNQTGNHLLCIQDTTEINYSNHIDRIGKKDKGIGPIGRDDNAGFFCHPTLVVDSKEQLPIGFSSIQIWNRSWKKLNKHERNYKNQPIETKESFRWIKSTQETDELLESSPMITLIADREADIYDEFVTTPNERCHLLIRSGVNRKLFDNDDTKLFDYLESQTPALSYTLPVKHNKKRRNRDAKMTLKFVKVKIKKPENTRIKEYPEFVEVWAIEAREQVETVPKGEDPIIWRLLTTHNISTAKDAMQCIEWYCQRWMIEELFRIVKSKGLQIESSQLETGTGLKKQLVMALQVALTTMTLKMAYETNQKVKAKIIFDQGEIAFMQALNPTLEGTTEKQKNPFARDTLAFCTWILARLSGWSGYASQPKPGYISIKQGLDVFNIKYEGYKLALSVLNNNTGKE